MASAEYFVCESSSGCMFSFGKIHTLLSWHCHFCKVLGKMMNYFLLQQLLKYQVSIIHNGLHFWCWWVHVRLYMYMCVWKVTKQWRFPLFPLRSLTSLLASYLLVRLDSNCKQEVGPCMQIQQGAAWGHDLKNWKSLPQILHCNADTFSMYYN